MSRFCLPLAVVLTCTAACSGRIAGGDAEPTPGDPGAGSGGARPPGAGGQSGTSGDGPFVGRDPTAAPKLPLRLLTRNEYDHSLRLVLQESYGIAATPKQPGAGLPGETIDLSGFLSVGELTDQHVLRHLEAASGVTSAIATALPQLVGCDLATVADDEACVRTFLPRFGELLYRRPLEAAEVDAHLAFYRSERKDFAQTGPQAISALIEAMLQSPHFLYRWEQGWRVAERNGQVVRLNPYQVASKLSFALWSSGPDRALLDLARAGGLNDAAAVAAQARKMLQSPRAAAAIDSFTSQWLGMLGAEQLFKDGKRFPEWTASLGAAMRQEVETFARHVVQEGDGKLGTLLGSSYTFVNEPLARLYGVAGVVGQTFRRVELDPGQRAGLLTTPGFAAVTSEASVPNPFRRGKAILEKMLCRTLEPPAEIPMPPALNPSDPRSVRKVMEDLTSAGSCRGCHKMLNPLGFALDGLDAIGKLRALDEAGKPIDAAGALPDDGTPFGGPAELARLLARSDEVRACMTRHWFRFATARHEEDADEHSLSTAFTGFAANDYDLRDLIVGLTTTRSFLYRTLEASESVEVMR